MANDDFLPAIRHSFAHLLAASVLTHYPDAKPTIGPAVDNGFYYDFAFPTPIGESDLATIEATMREILPAWQGFSHRSVSPDEARSIFAENPYKLELQMLHCSVFLTIS